ncbi:MAG TPA: hypothetical protein DC047_09365 [Blastocatellia bacterium]|nr:hypothetical protein [Blastocatellia bacterium]
MSRKQRAHKNHISLSLLIGVALFLLCACDHGIAYRPRGWLSTQLNRWSNTFDKVEIEIPEIGGLIGTESLMPEIVIHNHGDSVVVLESAVLKTRLADYSARPTEHERQWETIPPGGKGVMTLLLEFNKPIAEVLKDPIELRLKLRIGKQGTELSVPMERLSR